MAQCRLCNRSGFFLSVDSHGLCKNCNFMLAFELIQRVRIISESAQLIENSKKLDTQISRCDVIVTIARELLKYESNGIPTTNPQPSALIQQYNRKKDELVLGTLEAEFEALLQRLPTLVGARTQVNNLGKLLLRVQQYKAQCPLLAVLESRVKTKIQDVQLAAWLDTARKAEFKGQKKKALDQYYEALYFLRHDDVDDALQVEHITAIESKIRELGGDLTA